MGLGSVEILLEALFFIRGLPYAQKLPPSKYYTKDKQWQKNNVLHSTLKYPQKFMVDVDKKSDKK